VIEDAGQRQGLAQFTKYAAIIKNAPLAICVFLDNSATYNRDKDIMAVGAAIENMLLAAGERGLATCWLGEILNRSGEVQAYLKTDPDYELMAVITVGYSDEEVTKGCRRAFKSFIL
jgi:nitroreductase